jgi:cytochrome P450
VSNLKARFHESLIFITNRPVQFGTIKLTRLFGPIVYLPGVGYIVNDAALARQVLVDTEHFSSGGRGGLGDMMTKVAGHMHALINTQGEEHSQLKQNLKLLFSPAYVDNVVGEVLTDITRTMTTDLRAGKEVDIADYMKRSTSLMTAHMLGIPSDATQNDRQLRDIADTVNKLTKYLAVGKIDLTEAELADARQQYDKLSADARRGYDDTKIQPNSVIAELKKMGIEFEQAKSIVTVMLVAGTETVSSSFPRMLALLIDSGQWKVLTGNPDLIGSAIDEGLRYTSPAPVILHSCIADVTVGKYTFRKDRRVIVALHNILHDRKTSSKPSLFDITRKQNPLIKNLWFGAGPHMCLGFFLARKELQVSFEALMELGDLQIVKRRYARNVSFPCYEELWLKKV